MLNLIAIINEQMNPNIVEGQGPDYPESMKNMNKPKFRLPILYLDESKVHKLSETVSNDLELVKSSNKPLYEYLFKPTNQYAIDLLPEWNKQYTTDVDFLNDSKLVLKNITDCP